MQTEQAKSRAKALHSRLRDDLQEVIDTYLFGDYEREARQNQLTFLGVLGFDVKEDLNIAEADVSIGMAGKLIPECLSGRHAKRPTEKMRKTLQWEDGMSFWEASQKLGKLRCDRFEKELRQEDVY